MTFNNFGAKSLRPPLKWAGGKRWLVPHLMLFWEPYRKCRLVEPFCGGLAVAMGLKPEKALLNDINLHVINFFRWAQKGFRIEVPLLNDESLYYKHRERFNRLIEEGKEDSKEAAELFYYLNRTGYNGLCRFNRKGRFNVPFGRYKKINYEYDYRSYREIFEKWQFTCTDFEKLLLKEGDFIYADPPYDVEFTNYSKDGFDWQEQVRLVKWLTRYPGPVVLSNQATERIIELYRNHGYELRFLDDPRMISCTGDRTPAAEVLAVKGF